jgi:hypothetical protein
MRLSMALRKTRTTTAWTATLLGIGLAVFAAEQDVRKPKHKEFDLTVVAKYKTWMVANKEPVYVKALSPYLCADAFTSYPHAGWYIRVYVNPAGQKAFFRRGRSFFPEGSIILKEKLQTEESTQPSLCTIMIKRQKGYNPRNGDWEYAYFWGNDTKLQKRGRLQNCQSCHEKKAKSDYVFRTYLTDKDRKAYSQLTATARLAVRR